MEYYEGGTENTLLFILSQKLTRDKENPEIDESIAPKLFSKFCKKNLNFRALSRILMHVSKEVYIDSYIDNIIDSLDNEEKIQISDLKQVLKQTSKSFRISKSQYDNLSRIKFSAFIAKKERFDLWDLYLLCVHFEENTLTKNFGDLVLALLNYACENIYIKDGRWEEIINAFKDKDYMQEKLKSFENDFCKKQESHRQNYFQDNHREPKKYKKCNSPMPRCGKQNDYDNEPEKRERERSREKDMSDDHRHPSSHCRRHEKNGRDEH